jgi:hypothetical protein
MVQASRGVRQESAPLRAMSNGIALLCKSFVSQLSTFLIALVSLCALEQTVCRGAGISERDSEDSFTLTFRSHHGRLVALAHHQP